MPIKFFFSLSLLGRPEQIFFLLVTSIFPREFSRKSVFKKQFCKKTSLQLCHSRCRKQVSGALKWVQIKAFSSTHFLPAAIGSMIELEWWIIFHAEFCHRTSRNSRRIENISIGSSVMSSRRRAVGCRKLHFIEALNGKLVFAPFFGRMLSSQLLSLGKYFCFQAELLT